MPKYEPTTEMDHHPGISGVEAILLLHQGKRWYPCLYKHHTRECLACGLTIQPGDTAFRTDLVHTESWYICHRCGCGWNMHVDRLAPAEAARIPAIGGPAPGCQFTDRLKHGHV